MRFAWASLALCFFLIGCGDSPEVELDTGMDDTSGTADTAGTAGTASSSDTSGSGDETGDGTGTDTGTSDGGDACPPNLLDCDGVCVDGNVDPNNCGACGNVCGADEVCSAGTCGLTCVGGTTDCNGVCVDTQLDPANCGACGTACGTDEVCSAGTCGLTCVGGTTDCNGVCVDTQLDPANCGACGTACGTDEVCSAGSCNFSCIGGTTDCNGVCVDTQLDPANCGACGTACGAGEVCVTGTCVNISCGVNTYVLNGQCTACPDGTFNTAGDDPLGPDTVCDADPCEPWFGISCDQIQTGYLKASNTETSDMFGSTIAIDGNTLAIGALSESGDSASDGTPLGSNNNEAGAGAVYVFTRDPSTNTWTQEAYLKASNSDPGDGFGHALSLSGDILAIGAPYESSGAVGVNADQTDNSAIDSGAAYVFTRTGSIWSQHSYLKASNTDPGDRFGFNVALDGDSLAVGAWTESSCAVGVNQDQLDNGCLDAGAAYIFTRDPTTNAWAQQAYLKASNAAESDYFSYEALDLDGDTLVVGAIGEASGSPGVNGDQGDDSTYFAGAAYVFVRSGGAWSQQAYLKASNPDINDGFGGNVALEGDTLAVAAFNESSNATGINGDQNNNDAPFSGAAYVFVRDATDTWTQQAYLKASNPDANDSFGVSVAVSGDTVVVGAYGEDSNATGVNGDETNNSATFAGAAYVFVRSGDTWTQQAYLKASNTGVDDEFGISVAVSGDTVVVGAQGEDSNATGVNGDDTDNSAIAAGAAYVFDLDQF